jgi:hypothetical protein
MLKTVELAGPSRSRFYKSNTRRSNGYYWKSGSNVVMHIPTRGIDRRRFALALAGMSFSTARAEEPEAAKLWAELFE